MKIIDCVQGSPEWLAARAGIPTASEFDCLLTPEWKVRTGQMPETYLYRKLAEKVMGFPMESGSSFAMNQGTIMEHEAIPWFSFAHDMAVQKVGFVTTDGGRVGCSPDGLIGEDGGIEVKCPQPDTHLKYLLGGVVPKDYLAQVHGSMFVTGRKWWKFLSYSRQFPPLLLHVERDERIMAIIGNTLTEFLRTFDERYDEIMALRDSDNAEKQAAYDASVAAGRA